MIKYFKNMFKRYARSQNLAIRDYSSEPFTESQLTQFEYFSEFFYMVKDIPGDVVEVGFGRGNSFMILLYLSKQFNRHTTGFDSFEGFPVPTAEDKSIRNPQKGEWSVRTLKEATEQVNLFGNFDPKNYKIVKGFLGLSLPKLMNTKRLALIHVDVDLYSSHKYALEYLFPMLSKGGLVIFDDYGHEFWPGATLAVDEYFKGTQWQPQKHKSGKYFILK
jgi:hypothetical protein